MLMHQALDLSRTGGVDCPQGDNNTFKGESITLLTRKVTRLEKDTSIPYLPRGALDSPRCTP